MTVGLADVAIPMSGPDREHAMPATIRLPKRAPMTGRGHLALPDGVGGTISGGPMRPPDLTETLRRRAPEGGSASVGLSGVGLSGIGLSSVGLTGAASRFTAVDPSGDPNGDFWARERERDVALSDGSRIIFACLPSRPVRADA